MYNIRRIARNAPKQPAPRTSTHSMVWLIDDDAFANFIAERTIRQTHFAQEVVTFTMVEDALKLLYTTVAQQPDQYPSVIFIDINMPYLDGWDFLQAFEQLPAAFRESCELYMLSSAPNTPEPMQAPTAKNVRAFLSKPLSKEDVELIKLHKQGTWE